MNWAGKIIPIISGLGFITLIVGINLLYTQYDFAGLICTFLGALVLVPGLVLTFILNRLKKSGEHKVKYGRYIDKK